MAFESPIPPERFKALVAQAAQWVEEREGLLVQKGQPLSDDQLAIAQAVGVAHPERVRILVLKELPVPDGELANAGQKVGLFSKIACGRCFRYAIALREDVAANQYFLAHELAHTAQYERLGGIGAFIHQYAGELCSAGYQASTLELEADCLARLAYPLAARNKTQAALDYLNIPWRSGGASRDGASCSGLCWLWLKEQKGLSWAPPTLPADVPMQAQTMPAFKQENIEVGDIVFFRKRITGLVTHCAVCVQPGRYLHILQGVGSRIDSGFVLLRRLGMDFVGALSPSEAYRFYEAVHAEYTARKLIEK